MTSVLAIRNGNGYLSSFVVLKPCSHITSVFVLNAKNGFHDNK